MPVCQERLLRTWRLQRWLWFADGYLGGTLVSVRSLKGCSMVCAIAISLLLVGAANDPAIAPPTGIQGRQQTFSVHLVQGDAWAP